VLDYAGVERNENCSGESMLKIAEGETEREEVIGQFQRGDYGMYMLVTGEFKYIYSAPDQKEWLYDLVRDPEETRNRAENSLYAGKTEEMRERLIAYFSQEGYEEPIENNGWKKHSRKQISADPDANLLFQDPPASIPSLPGYETFSSARKYYRSIKLK
jgi:arylsulfatase A-like enzyme